MLKINDLISSGESLSINKRKDRSAFYENMSLIADRKDIRLSHDKRKLITFISGESEGIKAKMKNLFDKTVEIIKKTLKKIWELLKKAGRWIKYLLKGKLGDFKYDEKWNDIEKDIKETLDSSIYIWETFNKSINDGIYKGKPVVEDFIKRMKEIRAAYDSNITAKEKLNLVDEENDLRIKHNQTEYDIVIQTQAFSKDTEQAAEEVLDVVNELEKTIAKDAKNNGKNVEAVKTYVQERSNKSGSRKYKAMRQNVENAINNLNNDIHDAKETAEEMKSNAKKSQSDLEKFFSENFKKKNG